MSQLPRTFSRQAKSMPSGASRAAPTTMAIKAPDIALAEKPCCGDDYVLGFGSTRVKSLSMPQGVTISDWYIDSYMTVEREC